MFDKNSKLNFIDAVKKQDIDRVRSILKAKPEYRGHNFKNLPSAFVALLNTIDIIESTLEEQLIRITIEEPENKNAHDAYTEGKYISTISERENETSNNNSRNCKTAIEIEYEMIARSEAIKKKSKNKWLSSSPQEVIHEYITPNDRYRITDIFNFYSRQWKTITKDLEGGQITQETKSFDDVTDKIFIHEARLKLNYDFKGHISEGVVDKRITIIKKKKPNL